MPARKSSDPREIGARVLGYGLLVASVFVVLVVAAVIPRSVKTYEEGVRDGRELERKAAAEAGYGYWRQINPMGPETEFVYGPCPAKTERKTP